jgi:branched-chain amino acid transport system substrate-binding protein
MPPIIRPHPILEEIAVRGRSVVALGSAGALALGVAACGSGSSSGGSSSGKVSGSNLTIYSSLPLQGTSRGQSLAVINGEKLALKNVGGKVGKYTIKYVSLDDSTAQNPGSADDGQTQQNARKAVRDKTTIFYLGEFNSGGTKVSLPILNQGGIPQISPSNTYVGLTTNEPGSEPGEPQKYYPAISKYGRTYARTVPRDVIQGAALATVMKEDGCKTVDIWNDKTTYGAGIAKNVEKSVKEQGMQAGNKQGTDRNTPNYRSQAQNAKGDCFFWGGVTGENGVQVYKDVAASNTTAKLYGPDGVAEEAFTNPSKKGIPASVGKRVKFTVATLGVKDLPEAGPVLEKYKSTYNTKSVDPYGIYGYETMALALDALKRAGSKANDRGAVVKQLFNTKNRKSVIGTYSIDKNGDTTLTDYGLYTIKAGVPEYQKKIVAQK